MSTPINSRKAEALLDDVTSAVGTVLLGKRHQIRLALCCLLAKGHLLIEDLPGMGKTTLAQSLAIVLGLSFKRVQFTSDLLPADIVGLSIYQRQSENFRFLPGPIFTQLLLADEINRTTPKTQSALLEAMAEGQVTVDGQSRDLPDPFFVIATQNPQSQSGTYPLPESQQDRFALCISLGYPDEKAEKTLLMAEPHQAGRGQLASLQSRLTEADVKALQLLASKVRVSDAVADYLLRLVQFTRETEGIDCGLSPRASLSILACARAWALLERRDYVIPDDIQAIFPWAARHRLTVNGDSKKSAALIDSALNSIDIL